MNRYKSTGELLVTVHSTCLTRCTTQRYMYITQNRAIYEYNSLTHNKGKYINQNQTKDQLQ